MSGNILITGITGFLGRKLTEIIDEKKSYNIIGIYNSDRKYKIFKSKFPNIKCYKANIANSNFEKIMDNIVIENKINYIIHTAAMKYIDICEDNPIETLKTNVFATDSIINIAKKYTLQNVIVISTDKSNCPTNIYGMSKYIMEKIVLKNGFSIYQGVNFFGSDGSVIDIWEQQYKKNIDLTITDLNCIRYFNNINHAATLILDNLDSKSSIIIPDYVYQISMKQLFECYCLFRKYNKSKIIGKFNYEKIIEDLCKDITDIRDISNDEIIELLKNLV